MEMNYDPSAEWDKYCDMNDKAETEYIEKNYDKQKFYFDKWLEAMLSVLNDNHTVQQEFEHVAEEIINGDCEVKKDKLYSLLDEFPEVDALDNCLANELEILISGYKLRLEEVN